MAKETGIQWTDATWNPWHGCHKVSAGCKYCYMFRDKERYGVDPDLVMRSKAKFKEPLQWKEPMKVFTCSWSDWFISEADEWRPEAWEIIRQTPHLTYQILTKRPERIPFCLPPDWGAGYPNVWLGVSVENEAAIRRIRDLQKIQAAKRFISFEPLVGEIESLAEPIRRYSGFTNEDAVLAKAYDRSRIERRLLTENIDWIILGGESGNETGKYLYRPCKVAWMLAIIKAYQEHNPATKIFLKQLGTHLAKAMQLTPLLTMKERSGGVKERWPAILQIQEIPD